MVALNYEEIKCNPERVSNIKSFINKCKWKGKIIHQKYMIGKHLRKMIRQLFLTFCMLKKKNLSSLYPKN